MKKFLCTLLTLGLLMNVAALPVLAAEPENMETVMVTSDSEIQPRGAFSGSGSTKVGTNVRRGSFTFNVSGISNWPSGQIQLSITGFNSDDWVDAKVYRPDGTECFHILGILGDLLSPSKRSTGWHTYASGKRGTYKVEWSVGNWEGQNTGSGTIKCEIK